MKITYIITPFKSSAFLIRCVSSLLRQTYKDIEIIIAENSFDKTGEIAEFLDTAGDLKLISDQPQNDFDKIKEAVSLAQEESLINFISVNTVASPVASQTASETNADIIAVSHAVKDGEDYITTKMNDSPVINTEKADLQSIFIKKKLLSELSFDAISEKIPFELWIDNMIVEGVSEAVSDEVCFYLSSETLGKSDDDAQCCLQNKTKLLDIAEKALKANSKAGLFLFDKYLSKLYRLLISPKYDLEVKGCIFDLIKEIGELTKSNGFARNIYGLYIGGDIESLGAMDIETYLFYIERMITPVMKARLETMMVDIVTPIEKPISFLIDEQNEHRKKVKVLEKKVKKNTKSLKSLNNNFGSLKKKAKKNTKTLKSLKKDLGSLKKKVKTVDQKTNALSNPRQQVPALYAQGKLGMRDLIKSFKAWLKYKLSRKKK